jgi:hypothetical protein
MSLNALKSPFVTVSDVDLEEQAKAAHPNDLHISSPDLTSDESLELLERFGWDAGRSAAYMKMFA